MDAVKPATSEVKFETLQWILQLFKFQYTTVHDILSKDLRYERDREFE